MSHKPEKTVLPQASGGGPCGLGDPEDRTLRYVERDSLINKQIKKKIWHELCKDKLDAINECHKQYGVPLYIYKCREIQADYHKCWSHWFRDETLRTATTEAYLDDRSEYRRTGVNKRERYINDYRWQKYLKEEAAKEKAAKE